MDILIVLLHVKEERTVRPKVLLMCRENINLHVSLVLIIILLNVLTITFFSLYIHIFSQEFGWVETTIIFITFNGVRKVFLDIAPLRDLFPTVTLYLKTILQVLIYKVLYDKSYLGSKTTMTSGEWTCLISFATAPLTCSERGGSEKFKMKTYVSSGIRTYTPPVNDR